MASTFTAKNDGIAQELGRNSSPVKGADKGDVSVERPAALAKQAAIAEMFTNTQTARDAANTGKPGLGHGLS